MASGASSRRTDRVEELAALTATSQLVLADVRWRLGGPPGEPEFEAGHLPARSTSIWRPN